MNERNATMTDKIVAVITMLGLLVGAAVLPIFPGCKPAEKDAPSGTGATKSEEKHAAHHGGCLNAIETCAVGHAEVKLEGDTLRVWFVGGENETDKAVRVSDKQITLAVTPDGSPEKTVTLEAKPSELAEEQVGDCSYFEGQADWLFGVKKFSASGKVNLKAKERPVKIEYPAGYDPDDMPEKTGDAP